MISKLKTLLSTTFPKISIGGKHVAANQIEPSMSTAERIGPNRILFNARLDALPNHKSLGYIGLGVVFRGFAFGKSGEEAVVVCVLTGDNNYGPNDEAILEKRATLLVKQETKALSITFVDSEDRVHKRELIKIK